PCRVSEFVKCLFPHLTHEAADQPPQYRPLNRPGFGRDRQLDVRTIRSADFDGGQELTERAVAAYIAKYATKSAETATGALDRPLKFFAEACTCSSTPPQAS
ncbi:replication initiator, partial [Streptomyces sp. NPDC056165]|uniref:replication initiator n=1 Tax=Streptomyces sp. NPDC056165 TaxID=3345733 RepID=UPI0035D89472